MEEKTAYNQNSYVIPGAIIIFGIIIAGALLLTGSNLQSVQGNTAGFGNNLSPTAESVRPIDKNDHILGNANAKISIVEYSDFECPFCRRLHPTLARIVEESDGDVRWVYRHFPLTSIHSRALSASLASECAAELGGNDVFWKFAGGLFENQSALGRDLYARLATQSGISESKFISCLDSEKYSEHVQADRENAIASGGGGTPFNIIINEKGEVFPFSGALPYEQIKQIIEAALQS